MGKFLKKVWRYITAALTGKFEELADPKIQIEQAIEEAQKQHRLLTQQAANVIAHQKDTEMQLDRAMGQVEKMAASSRQALLMADAAKKKDDAAQTAKFEQAATAFAQRLIASESEVESLKTLHLQATEAAGNAKRAVSNNAMALEKKLTEKTKLLSQLDQAKMQERMNAAVTSMSATVGEEVPTLDEVRRKIEQRYAHALGTAELQEDSVESRMIEVEQASMDMEATVRLDEIRKQLGMEPAVPEPPLTAATPTPEVAAAEAEKAGGGEGAEAAT